MIIEKLILSQIMSACPTRGKLITDIVDLCFFWPFFSFLFSESHSWITSFKRSEPLEPRFLDAVCGFLCVWYDF